MQKTPLSFSSFSYGYSILSRYWWRDLLSYLTGIHVRTALMSQSLRTSRIVVQVPGWWSDLTTFYHRGRYGWAPRDVWNLNSHMEKVLAEMLLHLATNTHSYAPTHSPESWNTQLREWAADLLAFRQFLDSEEYVALALARDFKAMDAKETELVGRRDAALQGIIESWNHLWD